MIDPPVRSNRSENHCHCLLVEGDIENYCEQPTSGPDDPFCRVCSDRHPQRQFSRVEVLTYMDQPLVTKQKGG
jgi:hypothetical protein